MKTETTETPARKIKALLPLAGRILKIKNVDYCSYEICYHMLQWELEENGVAKPSTDEERELNDKIYEAYENLTASEALEVCKSFLLMQEEANKAYDLYAEDENLSEVKRSEMAYDAYLKAGGL